MLLLSVVVPVAGSLVLAGPVVGVGSPVPVGSLVPVASLVPHELGAPVEASWVVVGAPGAGVQAVRASVASSGRSGRTRALLAGPARGVPGRAGPQLPPW